MSLEDELEAQRRRAYEQRSPQERKARADAVTAVADAKVADRALNVGDRMPVFRLPAISGETVDAGRLLDRGPLVISFYRGGWCPYCNIELRALQGRLPEIEALGASLVAISPELPDRAARHRGQRCADVPRVVRPGQRGRPPVPADPRDRAGDRPLPAGQRQRRRRVQRDGHRGGAAARDVRHRLGRHRPVRLRGPGLHASCPTRRPDRGSPGSRGRRCQREPRPGGPGDVESSRSPRRCSPPSPVPETPGRARSWRP